MKGVLLLITYILLLNPAFAQSYKWVTGGGSTVSMGASQEEEQVQFMCTDSNKNIYMLSPLGNLNITADTFHRSSVPGGKQHIFLASYNCSGKLRWAKTIGAAVSTLPYGVVYDGGANIYIAADLFAGGAHIGEDTFVSSGYYNAALIKYDTGGHFKWVRFVGQDDYNTSVYSGGPSAIAIDGNGYIHRYSFMKSGFMLSSSISSIGGTCDLKYDAAGNLISATKMSSDSTITIQRVTINNHTNTAFAIMSTSTLTYIGAYSANDLQLWTDTFKLGGEVRDILCGYYNNLFLVGTGTPFVLGNDTFNNSYGNTHEGSFIFKMDTSDHVKWSFNVDGNLFGALGYITLVGNDKIACSGVLLGTAKHGNDSITSSAGEGFNPFFVVIDTARNLLKMDQLHGTGSDYDGGSAITSDKDGNIYIGGEVENSMTATGLGLGYANSGGHSDYFIAKYGYNCNCNITDEPTAKFTYSGNNFTYTGSIPADSVRWYFGDGTTATGTSVTHKYDTNGAYQVCVTSYYCDSSTYCENVYGTNDVPNVYAFKDVNVYPNPIGGQFYISGAEMGITVRLFNVIGQMVYQGTITSKIQIVNTDDLRLGTYVLQLIDKEGRKESMTLVKQ